MGRSRKARRRNERQRQKRPSQVPRLPAYARLLLAAVGLLLMGAGVLLLAGATPGTANRLGRLAGIAILLGVVAIVAAAIGHL